MYLDSEFKLINGWRIPRWARWVTNPDASPEARAALEQLLILNRTLRRLAWIVSPLQVAKGFAAAIAIIGGLFGLLVLLGVLLARAGVLIFWRRWEPEEETLIQQISDSPLFWVIVGATALAFMLHGVVKLIIGPAETERKALIDTLVLPEFRALRPTPRIEEFKVPESVPDTLAWETAGLLVTYDSVASRAEKLRDTLAKDRAHHLSTEEQQLLDEQQIALDRMQDRRAELATQIADSFYAVEMPITEELS